MTSQTQAVFQTIPSRFEKSKFTEKRSNLLVSLDTLLPSGNENSEIESLSTLDLNVHYQQEFPTQADTTNNARDGSSATFWRIAKSPRSKPKWANWAGNQTCNPEQIFSPTNLHDLINIVHLAKKNNKKIRCIGASHSYSSFSVTDGFMVSTHKMEQIFGAQKLSNIEIDAIAKVTSHPISKVSRGDSGTGISKARDVWAVTFESGVLVKDLDKWLKKHDPPLALHSNVVVDSHGAATHSRTLSDLIHQITIVDSNGDLQTLSANDESRAEEFSAACVSFGFMGIVYTYTLRVEPMDFRLQYTEHFPLMTEYFPLCTDPNTPVDEQADIIAGQKLRDFVFDSDQSEFFYLPFHTLRSTSQNGKLWIKRWQRTDAPSTHTKFHKTMENIGHHLQTWCGAQLNRVMARFPQVTPFVSYVTFKMASKPCMKVCEVPDGIHYQGGAIENMRFSMCEFAFKCDDKFINVIHAWRYVIEQMRFIKSSGAMMSNVYDPDPDAIFCTVEILSAKGVKDFEEFANNVGQYWMKNFNASPHWGKVWESMDNINQHLLNIYGDRAEKFESIRKKYDPQDMFLNNTFAKFLGQ
ncbi:hypothetical protein FBU30_008369 [Linnemannia zychae]|nr:hypothetical protein FBU30_008369 [Linnemannia zychae]